MNDHDIKVLRSKIGDHIMSADEAAEKYLCACGWTRTCQTPGCVWMWVRNVPAVLGGDIKQAAFYSAKDALAFQDRITAELHPLDQSAQALLSTG